MRTFTRLRAADNKGFGIAESLIILAVIAILGLGGWYVWNRNQTDGQTNTTQTSTNERASDEDSAGESSSKEWLEYRNEDARIKFKYPNNWTHTPEIAQANDDGSLGEVNGKLASPSGNTLAWHYAVWGGGGGECEPESDDTPFSDDNKCNSKKIYSVEGLSSPSSKDNPVIGSQRFVLTKTKYRSSAAGSPTTYHICLDAYYPDDKPQVSTRMNLLFPCEFWRSGFNAEYGVPNEAALNSSEAKTAEQIMRTFDTF